MISGALKGSCSESQSAIFFFAALESTTQSLLLRPMNSNLDQERCKELEFKIPHAMLELIGYQLTIY